jgi:hypothetical protein
MEIIALSGFARAGKDETAKVLVEEFGFKQVAFADKLREMLYQLDPLVAFEGPWLEEADGVTVQMVIDKFGWDGYKETSYGKEIRRLLQRLGTEAGRQTLWDSIWIDAALTGFSADAKIVVSDARFFNEFDAVRSRGGEVWRIERPGVGPANEHASEMEAISYPHFAKTLHNSRDLDYFRDLVKQAYGDFVTERSPVVTAKQMQTPADADGLRSKPLRPRNIPEGVINSYDVPKAKGRM